MIFDWQHAFERATQPWTHCLVSVILYDMFKISVSFVWLELDIIDLSDWLIQTDSCCLQDASICIAVQDAQTTCVRHLISVSVELISVSSLLSS